jgi:hypothetical protein
VLDASRRTLRLYGLQGLTTERIAPQAGISREPLERLLLDGAANGTLRETSYEELATVLC